MPAPNKSQLESLVSAYMQQNALRGENAPDLAGAMADVIAQALSLLMIQAKVAPGIPCSPGATTAPGRLL